jgi:hypothetical protein
MQIPARSFEHRALQRSVRLLPPSQAEFGILSRERDTNLLPPEGGDVTDTAGYEELLGEVRSDAALPPPPAT